MFHVRYQVYRSYSYLYCFSEELFEMQRTTREEKKRLRRSLREFEQEYQAKTGRRLQKEDRYPNESTYLDYKQAKAKLRFIDALITKMK